MLGGVKWRCEVDGGCGKKDQDTHIRFFSCVLSQMNIHSIALGKCSGTHWTLKWALTGVSAVMFSKLSWPTKLFATVIAQVFANHVMEPVDVIQSLRARGKCQVTQTALEWFFSSVSSSVIFQFTKVREFSGAKFTFVNLIFDAHNMNPPMDFQVRSCGKHLVTHITDMWLLHVVR